MLAEKGVCHSLLQAPKEQTHRRHRQVQEDRDATETETENEPSDIEKETLIHSEEK